MHLLVLLLKLTLHSLYFRLLFFVAGIAKAQPDKAIAPVTIKRRAAAHPKR